MKKAIDSAAPISKINKASSPASERVSISDAGKVAPQMSLAQAELDKNPLLAYAMPNWFGNYGFVQQPELGSVGYRSPTEDIPRDVLEKYSEKIDQHWLGVLRSNEISSGLDYYYRMIFDKSSSEDIHQQFVSSINKDPELLSLLNQVGKSVK